VLPRAAGQNPTAFRRAVRRAVLRVDPDGQDRRHRAAGEGRRVTLVPQPDGTADLVATLPAEQATAIYQRVDQIARGLPADERTADARRADVLTDLLLADSGTGGGIRPLVHVTVPATTLLGLDDQPGDLAGYGPVPATVARRIAADPSGTWRRLLTDPLDGTLLAHGRRTYRPPAALADHVAARDQTCRFPGCHHPARTADVDHTVPYPRGATSAGNLGALCRHHHRLKHHTQWTLTQHGGQFTWTSPTGRTYSRRPEPLDQPP
jgi:Domain of unknown function (DUF222)